MGAQTCWSTNFAGGVQSNCVCANGNVLPAGQQTTGDCKDVVCNGEDSTRIADNLSDLPPFDNLCNAPTCSFNAVAGTPGYTLTGPDPTRELLATYNFVEDLKNCHRYRCRRDSSGAPGQNSIGSACNALVPLECDVYWVVDASDKPDQNTNGCTRENCNGGTFEEIVVPGRACHHSTDPTDQVPNQCNEDGLCCDVNDLNCEPWVIEAGLPSPD
jgi:hypothetical protein